MRKYKLISDFYSIKVYKKIPVYAGFGGGTSNAATVYNYLQRKKIKKNVFNKIVNHIGSDLRLFIYKQGYLKNLQKVIKFKKKHPLNFLLVYPNVRCSTKEIYSKVKKFSKQKLISQEKFATKNNFLNCLVKSGNDLQSIVEKKHPIIKKLLMNISNSKGCLFSRMTGSGSACYGIFYSNKCSKVALKKLRKKYTKYWFSIAKTI